MSEMARTLASWRTHWQIIQLDYSGLHLALAMCIVDEKVHNHGMLPWKRMSTNDGLAKNYDRVGKPVLSYEDDDGVACSDNGSIVQWQ
jgi:hypothetical protein